MSRSTSGAANKVRIFECFPFYNELEILEIHLNVLAPHIDYFVIVEATKNFMGQDKPLYFQENRERFAEFSDKIIHVVVDDMPEELPPTALDANRRAMGFKREAHQRRAMGRGLKDARPDDLIIISDVDEIIKPHALMQAVKRSKRTITYFEGVYYHFYFNWRVVGYENLNTSRMIEMKYFKDGQHMRKSKGRRSERAPNWLEYLMWLPYTARRHGKFLRKQIMDNGCWHLSFIMNSDRIRDKLKAYSHSERTTEEFIGKGRIEERIASKTSMFGNPIEVDPIANMPQYIIDNLDRYGRFVDFGSESDKV